MTITLRYGVLLATAIGTACPAANAVLWPFVTEIQAVDCKRNKNYECGIYRLKGRAEYLEIGRPPGLRPNGRNAEWWGIHCGTGSRATGEPYSGCSFEPNSHGPSNWLVCKFHNKGDLGDWELDKCVVPPTWEWGGTHQGADIGGECSVFGVAKTSGATDVYTPSGILNATAVANAGSGLCVKPVPPTIPCSIGNISDIDHGAVGPDSTSVESTTVAVACGATPVVQLVGGTDIVLAAGVTSRLSAQMVTATTLRVESRLTVLGGKPGQYSASKIVVVSPY